MIPAQGHRWAWQSWNRGTARNPWCRRNWTRRTRYEESERGAEAHEIRGVGVGGRNSGGLRRSPAGHGGIVPGTDASEAGFPRRRSDALLFHSRPPAPFRSSFSRSPSPPPRADAPFPSRLVCVACASTRQNRVGLAVPDRVSRSTVHARRRQPLGRPDVLGARSPGRETNGSWTERGPGDRLEQRPAPPQAVRPSRILRSLHRPSQMHAPPESPCASSAARLRCVKISCKVLVATPYVERARRRGLDKALARSVTP